MSFQSWVVYGHVGHSAVLFPLQRLGHEVYAVHTVQFAAHAGYGPPQGTVIAPDVVRALIDGVAARGAFPSIDGILSGYLGSAALGAVILDGVAAIRKANPAALYLCDPVMGDVGRGLYVATDIADFFRDKAVPAADIVTPNHFELERLAGQSLTTREQARMAARQLRASGPHTVLVTSLKTNETPHGEIDMLVSSPEGEFILRTPLLPLEARGTGDLTAALFLAHRLSLGHPRPALERTAATLYDLLQQTHAAGSAELRIVAAQDCITAPKHRFEALALA